MKIVSTDVLVIGSGAAGLRAAIGARLLGLETLVVCKSAPGKGTATILSGAAFRGAWAGSSPEEHRAQVLAAGRGLNEPDLLEAMVQDAPVRFQEMLDWGLRAESRPGRLLAKGRARVWGEEIIRCFLAKAQEAEVRFLPGVLVRAMSFQDGRGYLAAFHPARNEFLGLTAKAVVLAAGGAGGLFLRHDNPQRILGDAYALGYRAGATLQDMEFVQFFPLLLAEPDKPNHLVPPALADLGRIYNNRGEDILVKYGITERPAAIKARDRLSQALFQEMVLQGQEVRLDLTKVAKEDWLADPLSASTWEILGDRCDGWREPLLVAPACHFVMGGLSIDTTGATSRPGLFAAGEAAGGVHGANRMGGNALTETVVFGARAGEAAGQWAKSLKVPVTSEIASKLRALLPCAAPGQARMNPRDLKARLKETMWRQGGICRDEAGLNQGLGLVREIGAEAARTGEVTDPQQLNQYLELQLAAQASELILESALRRKESRGAHFRLDFPKPDPAFLGHLKVRLEAGEPEWSFHEIG